MSNLQENKQLKNEPFFQFRKHNFKIIRKMYNDSPKAGELFTFLIENMNEKTNSLIVSQEAIAKILNCTTRTVQRVIKYLTDNQYIKIIKTGTSNIYCVNADIVWTQSAEGLKFAKFNTSVYVVEEEQSEVFRTEINTNFEKILDAERVLINPFETSNQ